MIRPLLKVIFYLALLVGLYACIIKYFAKDKSAEFNPKVIEILKSVGEDRRTVIVSKPDTIIVISRADDKDSGDYSNDPDVKFVSGDKVINKNQPKIDAGVKDGLVAYYPFNGNANDASGNKNHGIVHGATLTEDRFGNAKSAYYFDGIDDEIYLGESKLFDIRATLTIYLEMKVKSVEKNISPIIYKGLNYGGKEVYNGSERTYSVWVDNTGLLHLSTADNSGSQYLNTQQKTIMQNEWYSYAAVIDRKNGIMKSYLNGVLLATAPIRKGLSVSTGSPLLIGSSLEKISKFSNFHGTIDNVKIYDRALREVEIEKLFSNSLSK